MSNISSETLTVSDLGNVENEILTGLKVKLSILKDDIKEGTERKSMDSQLPVIKVSCQNSLFTLDITNLALVDVFVFYPFTERTHIK